MSLEINLRLNPDFNRR